MRRKIGLGIGMTCVLAAALVVYAQEHDGKHDGAMQQGAQDSEAMQKMWEEYAKQQAPGEKHEALKPLTGNWEMTSKYRMSPETPWEESKSQCTSEWILGKRFLTQKISGEPMPPFTEKFEGFGIFGYDTQKKKYTSVWMDNMSTMTMYSEGTAGDDGKTITFKGDFTDCMTGQETWMKTIYKIQGDNKYVMEMYCPDESGKEFLMMEITSTKKM